MTNKRREQLGGEPSVLLRRIGQMRRIRKIRGGEYLDIGLRGGTERKEGLFELEVEIKEAD